MEIIKRPKKEEKSKKKSALEEIMEEEESRKKRLKLMEKETKAKNGYVKPYWLKKNIVVKIVTKSLGDKYYKQKGVVTEVVDKFGGVIKLLNGDLDGKKLKLDQEHLETVIPSEGREILVVNGEYRGEVGTLVKINVEKFCATVKLLETGEKVDLPYEHFSKLSA